MVTCCICGVHLWYDTVFYRGIGLMQKDVVQKGEYMMVFKGSVQQIYLKINAISVQSGLKTPRMCRKMNIFALW